MTSTNTPAVINQQEDLAHLEQLVKDIISMKDGYKDLVISGPDDKEGYEQVRVAIGALRSKRTGSDKERKEIGKPYRDTLAFINSRYDEIEALIQDGPGGEDELKAKKKEIDDIVDKAEQERKRLEEEKINNRINELLKNGMMFDGEYYSIKDDTIGIPETSIGVVDLRTMSDDLYKNMLQLVQDKNKKIIAEKERLADLERQRLKEEEEKRKEDKRLMEEQQKKLDEQAEKLREQEQQLKLQQEKIEEAKREEDQKVIRHRSAILSSMGLEYNANNDSYDYNDEALLIGASALHKHDDAEWLNLTQALRKMIASKQEEADKLLKQKEQDEKERLAKQEQDRLDGLSDKEKMTAYINALLAIPVPTGWKTKKWKGLAGAVRDHISDNLPA